MILGVVQVDTPPPIAEMQLIIQLSINVKLYSGLIVGRHIDLKGQPFVILYVFTWSVECKVDVVQCLWVSVVFWGYSWWWCFPQGCRCAFCWSNAASAARAEMARKPRWHCTAFSWRWVSLWVYYNFVIKISRKKHTRPPSTPSFWEGRVSAERKIYLRQSKDSEGKIYEWEREKKKEEVEVERRGSKLKVAKWRYWVSRGVRQE